MAHITHQAHLEAPPDLVFARAIDPELMPRYMPSMQRIWDVQGAPDQVGSSFRFAERVLGRDHEARVEVVAVDPPRMQTTLTTYDNGTTVRWEFHLETAPDHGTDGIDLIDYEVPSGLVNRLADRLFLRRRIEQSLEDGAKLFGRIVEAEAKGT